MHTSLCYVLSPSLSEGSQERLGKKERGNRERRGGHQEIGGKFHPSFHQVLGKGKMGGAKICPTFCSPRGLANLVQDVGKVRQQCL